MRLKRRKRCKGLTDEEQAKIDEAQAAANREQRVLTVTRRRSAEVAAIATWLHRARQEDHFGQRVQHMIENPGEDPPPWT